MFILDASVVLKWFVEEEKISSSRDIRDRYIQRRNLALKCSWLPLHESANALLSKQSFTEYAVTEVVQTYLIWVTYNEAHYIYYEKSNKSFLL